MCLCVSLCVGQELCVHLCVLTCRVRVIYVVQTTDKGLGLLSIPEVLGSRQKHLDLCINPKGSQQKPLTMTITFLSDLKFVLQLRGSVHDKQQEAKRIKLWMEMKQKRVTVPVYVLNTIYSNFNLLLELGVLMMC